MHIDLQRVCSGSSLGSLCRLRVKWGDDGLWSAAGRCLLWKHLPWLMANGSVPLSGQREISEKLIKKYWVIKMRKIWIYVLVITFMILFFFGACKRQARNKKCPFVCHLSNQKWMGTQACFSKRWSSEGRHLCLQITSWIFNHLEFRMFYFWKTGPWYQLSEPNNWLEVEVLNSHFPLPTTYLHRYWNSQTCQQN